MFPPTNESFIRHTVQSTQTYYQRLADDDQVPNGSQAYQSKPGIVRGVLHLLGHAFMGIGKHLEDVQAHDATLKPQPGRLGS
jgi:hypothetical protein